MITTEFDAAVVVTGNQPCYIPIQVTLSYDEEYDPFAVQMLFSWDGGETAWTFARDLLYVGANSYMKVGGGDVRLRYEGADKLLICLSDGVEHSDVRMPHSAVIAFLEETMVTVKRGDECVTEQLDEVLKEILSS